MFLHNELTECSCALFTSLNENKLISKYLWHQQRKNFYHIFQHHARLNCNFIFLNNKKKKCYTSALASILLMSIFFPITKKFPYKNNTLWKITHDIKYQHFFRGSKM